MRQARPARPVPRPLPAFVAQRCWFEILVATRQSYHLQPVRCVSAGFAYLVSDCAYSSDGLLILSCTICPCYPCSPILSNRDAFLLRLRRGEDAQQAVTPSWLVGRVDTRNKKGAMTRRRATRRNNMVLARFLPRDERFFDYF